MKRCSEVSKTLYRLGSGVFAVKRLWISRWSSAAASLCGGSNLLTWTPSETFSLWSAWRDARWRKVWQLLYSEVDLNLIGSDRAESVTLSSTPSLFVKSLEGSLRCPLEAVWILTVVWGDNGSGVTISVLTGSSAVRLLTRTCYWNMLTLVCSSSSESHMDQNSSRRSLASDIWSLVHIKEINSTSTCVCSDMCPASFISDRL